MAVPTVDLSPFFASGDEGGRKKVKDIIREACEGCGLFQIVNHGIPLHLITQSIELSRTFFALPEHEKLKYGPDLLAPLQAGYNKQPALSFNKGEYFLMYHRQYAYNILPQNPPDFGNVLGETFQYLKETGELLEGIMNDCLGLPTDFLKEYDDDRSHDILVSLCYAPATETCSDGLVEHGDPNCITLVIQDEVGGLEVKIDGKWVSVVPIEGAIVVNIGDVMQVLTNNKFKSAAHKVVRTKGKWRQSLAFSLNISGEKWVAPLPQFTEEIGAAPKYKGFFYKEYQALRKKNSTHPPLKLEDGITIARYEIST